MFSHKPEKLNWKLFRTFFRLFPGKMRQVLFSQLPPLKADEIEQAKGMAFKQASGSGFVTDLKQKTKGESIKKIKCTTLILHSENDGSVPATMPWCAEQQIKNAVFKTFNNKWGQLLWVGEESKYPIGYT